MKMNNLLALNKNVYVNRKNTSKSKGFKLTLKNKWVYLFRKISIQGLH